MPRNPEPQITVTTPIADGRLGTCRRRGPEPEACGRATRPGPQSPHHLSTNRRWWVGELGDAWSPKPEAFVREMPRTTNCHQSPINNRRVPSVIPPSQSVLSNGARCQEALNRCYRDLSGERRCVELLRRERQDHTLQRPAFMKRSQADRATSGRWQNSDHSSALRAGERRILVDHARAHVATNEAPG